MFGKGTGAGAIKKYYQRKNDVRLFNHFTVIDDMGRHFLKGCFIVGPITFKFHISVILIRAQWKNNYAFDSSSKMVNGHSTVVVLVLVTSESSHESVRAITRGLHSLDCICREIQFGRRDYCILKGEKIVGRNAIGSIKK